MTATQQIFLFPSPEVQKLLAENSVDLQEMLRAKIPDVQFGLAEDPSRKDRGGERELVTVILVSAVAVAALMPLIKDAFRMACGRPTTVTDLVPTPMLDGAGKPILKKNGEPLIKWAKVTKELTPPQSVTFQGFGLEIKIGD